MSTPAIPYRLIYDPDTKAVLVLEPNVGARYSPGTLFVAPLAACQKQIAKLGLTLTPDPSVAAAKAAAKQAYAAAVAAGYTVPGLTPPLVLDLSDEAQGKFTSLLVLLNALMSNGQILATSVQTIADKNGVPRALPVSQIESILLGYGVYYAGLFNALHSGTVAS